MALRELTETKQKSILNFFKETQFVEILLPKIRKAWLHQYGDVCVFAVSMRY